jgi:hypothetical protein
VVTTYWYVRRSPTALTRTIIPHNWAFLPPNQIESWCRTSNVVCQFIRLTGRFVDGWHLRRCRFICWKGRVREDINWKIFVVLALNNRAEKLIHYEYKKRPTPHSASRAVQFETTYAVAYSWRDMILEWKIDGVQHFRLTLHLLSTLNPLVILRLSSVIHRPNFSATEIHRFDLHFSCTKRQAETCSFLRTEMGTNIWVFGSAFSAADMLTIRCTFFQNWYK